ncbi:MAG: DUF2203 domain-containing protein [Deltaproteobacteria bacterium]|nr:DUF2203 domain-containing protein [Deltaproteobacteria bacterium]
MSAPDSPRVFTPEEVDALIPELRHQVATQLALGQEISRLLRRLGELIGSPVASLDPDPSDSAAARDLRATARDAALRYQEGWARVHALGAVVKDTSVGLLDFYGRVDGRLVWLCWRFGEDRLGHYHELDTGFSARRPLGAVERSRALN